jgi:hypothetical protein
VKRQTTAGHFEAEELEDRVAIHSAQKTKKNAQGVQKMSKTAKAERRYRREY